MGEHGADIGFATGDQVNRQVGARLLRIIGGSDNGTYQETFTKDLKEGIF